MLRQHAVKAACQLISTAKNLVVLTGAGISTPSGIPDFRSQSSGVWNSFNPLEVASITAFRYHPEKFFGWIGPLYAQIRNARPNPAHVALALLEATQKLRVVITQNIDNLHQAAGSKKVVEIHGSIRNLSCLQCGKIFTAEPFVESLTTKKILPRCPDCHQILKPDIILYEEPLVENTWQQALQHCYSADLLWVIGSSLEVVPAAHLPLVAIQHGARLVITNYSQTTFDSYADVLLPFNIAEIVPEIVEKTINGNGQ